jgi:hypothetical protein
MRAAVLLLAAVPLAGCPSLLAPPPTDGAGQGATCSADWECENGLACECGVCTTPSATPRPPACNLDVGDQCDEDNPSPCFAACGDLDEVGVADCVDGRESCTAVGGVLASQCADDQCWGESAPGEACVDGEWVCEFGEAASGDCYTFDCDAVQSECVQFCGDQNPQLQVCVASEWVCESGIDIDECGECVGAPPSCVRSCDDLSPLGASVCDLDDLTWSCDHIQLGDAGSALTATACCAPSTTLRDVADLADFGDVSCVAGTLSILTGGLLQADLPNLERVTDLQVSSGTLERVRLPALVEVESALVVENNWQLTELSAPVLATVGTGMYFANNPRLCACDIWQLRRQFADGGSPGIDIETGNLPCLGWPYDGGPQDAGAPGDAGSGDGGSPLDGGPDGGPALEAGPSDAGPSEAGPGDAGPAPAFCTWMPSDGGVTDAGATDSGPGDAGDGSDGGSDAGSDGGFDAGADAGSDAGADGGFDGGFDGGVDGGVDAGDAGDAG